MSKYKFKVGDLVQCNSGGDVITGIIQYRHKRPDGINLYFIDLQSGRLSYVKPHACLHADVPGTGYDIGEEGLILLKRTSKTAKPVLVPRVNLLRKLMKA